jgi:MFS family permease
MYLAYKAIRKKVKEAKSAKEAKRATEPGLDNVGEEDVSSGVVHVSDPDASADQPHEARMDPEQPREDNDSLVTGIPNDARNRSSKRSSYLALLLQGAAMALDFTMALMSIQTFYYVLGGPPRLYGFTFGSYDLTALLVAPLLGFVSDKTKKFKFLFLMCMIMNASGNLIYAFTFLGDEWYMMLIARLIAGVGAASLGLGSSYITSTTTMEQRQKQLVTYRVSQSLARFLGPFVGYIFLGLPTVSSSSSTALKVFNWYTIPGWVAFFVVAFIFVFFLWKFHDPTEENEHIVRPQTKVTDNSNSSRVKEFRTFMIIWLCMVFTSTFLQFGYYANLFGLFAGQFHGVTDQYEQWKVFVAVGVGAVMASTTYRTGVKVYPKIFNERVMVIVSAWIFFVVYMLVIPFGGSTEILADGRFYASSGLFGLGVVLGAPAVEAVFSKKITQFQDVVGENIAKLLGIFYMCQSCGRFAGPLVAGAVTYIATPSGQQNYCPDGETLADDGTPMCAGNTTQACAIFPDQYYVEGCVLKHAVPFFSVLAGIGAVTAVLYMLILKRYWSYTT